MRSVLQSYLTINTPLHMHALHLNAVAETEQKRERIEIAPGALSRFPILERLPD